MDIMNHEFMKHMRELIIPHDAKFITTMVNRGNIVRSRRVYENDINTGKLKPPVDLFNDDPYESGFHSYGSWIFAGLDIPSDNTMKYEEEVNECAHSSKRVTVTKKDMNNPSHISLETFERDRSNGNIRSIGVLEFFNDGGKFKEFEFQISYSEGRISRIVRFSSTINHPLSDSEIHERIEYVRNGWCNTFDNGTLSEIERCSWNFEYSDDGKTKRVIFIDDEHTTAYINDYIYEDMDCDKVTSKLVMTPIIFPTIVDALEDAFGEAYVTYDIMNLQYKPTSSVHDNTAKGCILRESIEGYTACNVRNNKDSIYFVRFLKNSLYTKGKIVSSEYDEDSDSYSLHVING